MDQIVAEWTFPGGMGVKSLPNGRNWAEWTERRMGRDGKMYKKSELRLEFQIISERRAGIAVNARIRTNTTTTWIHTLLG